MPTRKANEADLSDESPDGCAVRPRTGGAANTTNCVPTLHTNPLAVFTTPTVNPPTAQALTNNAASPATDEYTPPTAMEAQEPEDTDAEMKALDILTYIHLPRPDPLQIHGWDSTKALENVSEEQIPKWNKNVGPKVLIYKAHGAKFKKDCIEETLQIRELIKDFLKTETNPSIATPVPEHEQDKKDDPPFCALMRGLSQEQTDELVKKVSHAPPPTSSVTH